MTNALNAITNQEFISAICLTIILILVGYFLVKYKILPENSSKVVSTIVMKVALPCLAFAGYMGEFSLTEFGVLIFSFIAYCVLFLIGKLFFFKYHDAKKDIYRIIFAMGQVSLFSLPLVKSIFGSSIIPSTNMILFSFRIFLYIYCFFLISGIEINKKNLFSSLKKVILNPIMIGMILGVIIWVTQGIMPQVIKDDVSYSIFRIDVTIPFLYKVIDTIGDLSIPLGMLLVGMTLGNIPLKQALSNKMAYLLSFMRSLIAPMMVLGLCLIWNLIFKDGNSFHFSRTTIEVLVICFAAPVSVAIDTYCVAYKKEEIMVSDCIFISTLMSIIAIPLLIVMVELIF